MNRRFRPQPPKAPVARSPEDLALLDAAKSLIMQLLECEEDGAWEQLRYSAMHRRVPMKHLAQEIHKAFVSMPEGATVTERGTLLHRILNGEVRR